MKKIKIGKWQLFQSFFHFEIVKILWVSFTGHPQVVFFIDFTWRNSVREVQPRLSRVLCRHETSKILHTIYSTQKALCQYIRGYFIMILPFLNS